MTKKDQLFQIADSQQGYFTSQQARLCGFLLPHFPRYVAAGEWSKEQRGIYRLARYPVTECPELVLWSLWSRSKLGEIQGTWSHETALDIYELSDVMPSKMHMTVPKRFRKSSPLPPVLVLYFTDLDDTDVRWQQGYRVTTPLRTLADIVIEATLSEDLIVQALTEALRRGLVSHSQFSEQCKPETAAKILGLIDSYDLKNGRPLRKKPRGATLEDLEATRRYKHRVQQRTAI